MSKKIASIINYCSNDMPFLKACLNEVRKFSDKIIIPVADHLFNGQKEDLQAMKRIFSEFDFATFIIYPFIPEKIPKRIQKKVKKNAMWPSISRMVGANFVEKDIDYLFFLDVDEIVDGERFKCWLEKETYRNFQALRPANYWYFRSTSSQATVWEDTAVLIKRNKIKRKSLLDSGERDAIFSSVKGKKIRSVLGLDNLPMIHHYSWVKTKKQMLLKAESWSHKDDKNWKELIENEFKQSQSDKDFVHGYDLVKVSPFVNIDIEQNRTFENGTREYINSNNVVFLADKKLLNMIIKRSFKDYLNCYLEKLISY